MNAQEAKRKTLNIREGKNHLQYEAILEVINEKVLEGKFATYFYESLSMGVQNKLTMDGYHISEHSDQRDGTTITISW